MKIKRTIDSSGIIRFHNENGEMHNETGPALLRPDGSEYWYYKGVYHRDDGGPAILDYKFRFRQWRKFGEIHRIGAPAIIEFKGTEWWFIEGKLHREDGPALYYPLTNEIKWCYKYKLMSFEKWCEALGKTNEEIVQLKLIYGNFKEVQQDYPNWV